LKRTTKEKPVPENITRAKPIRHNAPEVEDLHKRLMQLTGGVDASQITGFTDKTLLELISEIGLDLSRWETEKQFTSWLGLTPSKYESGKSKKKKRRKIHTKAGQIFRQMAFSIANSKHSALGGFYRRIKAKKGWLVAMKATARKLAVLYYNIMTKGMEYVEEGIIQYQEKFKELQMKKLKKQAKYFGLELTLAIA
jgi:transposase